MTIGPSSLAVGVGSTVQNVTFQPTAQNVPRKILIIGTYDPAKTGVVDEVPVLITSPEDAGDKFGFGFMIHRLAVPVNLGSGGVETWVQPQAEAAGAQSAGDITFTATGVVAGTVYLYIAGIAVPFTVATGDDATAVATACVAAISANSDLPVTATNTLGVVDITSKSEGPWGDDITIRFNINAGEELPTGVGETVTDMTGGSGIPSMANALDGLGTGDNANEKFFTDMVHGYGQDTTTLDAISTYVGPGNDFVGLYAKTVGRPFRALTGDIAAGSAGLTALVALGDGRKTDRANGIIAVPGSANHPSEIAAQTIGHMARISDLRAEQSYAGTILSQVDPGALADRWTSDYDDRDTAVKSGISPTRTQGGAVLLQNVVSFYHPDSVPVTSNGYREMRNIAITQNVIDNVRTTFEAEKWQGISIVQDVTLVGNTLNRQKARDIDSVKDDLVALLLSFEDNAWIYSSAFSIEKLNESTAVTIRTGNDGFNINLSVIYSGIGNIVDANTQFDTSIAVLT